MIILIILIVHPTKNDNLKHIIINYLQVPKQNLRKSKYHFWILCFFHDWIHFFFSLRWNFYDLSLKYYCYLLKCLVIRESWSTFSSTYVRMWPTHQPYNEDSSSRPLSHVIDARDTLGYMVWRRFIKISSTTNTNL